MFDPKLINVSERYGDPVEVTIEDYQELNPDGRFEFDHNGNIREYFGDDNSGNFEVVAEQRE